jgi:hypothetical protein
MAALQCSYVSTSSEPQPRSEPGGNDEGAGIGFPFTVKEGGDEN